MDDLLPTGAPTAAKEASARIYACVYPDVDVLRMMMLLEASGRSAYEDLAREARDEAVAKLLRANAREEMAHAHRIRLALKILTGTDFRIPTEAKNPYVVSRRGTELTQDLLGAMAASERNGDALYRTWAANARDPEVAALFTQNGIEEAGHSARLEEAASRLRGCSRSACRMVASLNQSTPNACNAPAGGVGGSSRVRTADRSGFVAVAESIGS